MGALGNTSHSIDIGNKTITFEGGKLAQQAGGSVVASLGDTTIMTTTTASSRARPPGTGRPSTARGSSPSATTAGWGQGWRAMWRYWRPRIIGR